MVGLLWAYVGTGSLDSSEALPLFLSSLGGLVGVVTGLLGASYAGIKIVEASVKTGGYARPLTSIFFYQYGGNSWIGNLLGFFESTWVALWLVFDAVIAFYPF